MPLVTTTGVQPSKRNKRRLRWGLVLALSVVLHVGLLIWLAAVARRALSSQPRPPLALTLLPPSLPPSPPPLPPLAKAKVRQQGPRLRATPESKASPTRPSVVVPAGPQTSTPAPDDSPRASKPLRLPTMGQLALPATRPTVVPEPDGMARLKADLAFAKAAAAAKQGARSTLVDMAHNLQRSFTPTPVTGAAAVGHLEAFANQLGNELVGLTKPIAIDHLDNDLTPAARQSYQQLWQDTQFKLCFGNCGQQHSIAAHLAIVRIEHDEGGQPISWRFRVTSGVAILDARIAEVVERAARQRLSHFPGEPIPEWSEWSFSQVVYRWSRSERVLDPLFRPPGLVVDELSDIAGTTSVTTNTELMAVVYRHSAPTPASRLSK